MEVLLTINLDKYLWAFLENNYAVATIIVMCLKVLAKHTPWAADDEIVQIITNFLNRKEMGNKQGK